uniref:Uncharacterized protein n=1 Tax=Cacopsylla melanoneura TaxID=428564 RepID=A0A8D8ZIG6_9HEMI
MAPVIGCSLPMTWQPMGTQRVSSSPLRTGMRHTHRAHILSRANRTKWCGCTSQVSASHAFSPVSKSSAVTAVSPSHCTMRRGQMTVASSRHSATRSVDQWKSTILFPVPTHCLYDLRVKREVMQVLPSTIGPTTTFSTTPTLAPPSSAPAVTKSSSPGSKLKATFVPL